MAFFPRGDGSDKRLTKEAAKEMLEKEGFLFGELPSDLQRDPELLNICNNWWRNRIFSFIMYYREHPDKLQELMKKKGMDQSKMTQLASIVEKIDIDE